VENFFDLVLIEEQMLQQKTVDGMQFSARKMSSAKNVNSLLTISNSSIK